MNLNYCRGDPFDTSEIVKLIGLKTENGVVWYGFECVATGIELVSVGIDLNLLFIGDWMDWNLHCFQICSAQETPTQAALIRIDGGHELMPGTYWPKAERNV